MKMFNKSKSFNDRNNRDRPAQHRAVCAKCGKTCEVPFKPTGDKPVYCSECFKGKSQNQRGYSQDRDYGRSRRDDKRMYQAVCSDCGKNCEVPFQPSSDKPVYCNNCFSKGGNSTRPSEISINQNQQFDLLNSKLDRILQALSNDKPAKIEKTEKIKSKDKKEDKKSADKKTKAVKKVKAKKIKK